MWWQVSDWWVDVFDFVDEYFLSHLDALRCAGNFTLFFYFHSRCAFGCCCCGQCGGGKGGFVASRLRQKRSIFVHLIVCLPRTWATNADSVDSIHASLELWRLLCGQIPQFPAGRSYFFPDQRIYFVMVSAIVSALDDAAADVWISCWPIGAVVFFKYFEADTKGAGVLQILMLRLPGLWMVGSEWKLRLTWWSGSSWCWFPSSRIIWQSTKRRWWFWVSGGIDILPNPMLWTTLSPRSSTAASVTLHWQVRWWIHFIHNCFLDVTIGKSTSQQSTRESECIYLNALVTRLLIVLVPAVDSSPFFRIILRDVIVNQIVLPLVDYLSDPDYFNQTLDDVCNRAIHEQVCSCFAFFVFKKSMGFCY